MNKDGSRQPAWPYFRWLLLAAGFGALGALAAEAFRHALDWTTARLFGTHHDIALVMVQAGWTVQLLAPTLGGLAAGLILVAANRYQQSRKLPAVDYLETIDGRMGAIPVVPSLLRCLSSFCSILSGGSVGKEGAMVQLSSTVASALAVRGRLHGERLQMMIAVAATGGLAAVYHTPLAAAIFVAEIAFGGLEFRRLALLFTGAVASTALIMAMGLFKPMYPLALQGYYLDAATLGATLLVALAAALAGLAMLQAIGHARGLFGRVPGGPPVRMGLGGLLVGLLIMAAPEVAGNGFVPLAQLLRGDTLSTALLVLLALKVAATAATVGSGAVGGLFTPALLVGALAGMVCTGGLAALFGLQLDPALYAVVGMASALAATTQAPLMSTLMALELTQEPVLVFPVMLATVIAYGTPHLLHQAGVYPVVDRHRQRYARRDQLYEARAGDAMRPLDAWLPGTATLAQARELALRTRRRFVFVLDQDHAFRGAIRVHDLMAVPEGAEPALQDLMDPAFPTVLARDRLVDIWQTVVDSPAERLPVLADAQSRRVVGVLPKSEVLQAAGRTLI
ncbi:chloride channel protein [Orrella sp. JC864]|uniref:chloride channel protein n=1 Tax=Orrella sp. JC864 TaxID=3120298 RepID=UPI00300A5EC6